MRHLQRMQTGVAITALVFILTSAATTIQQSRHRAVTAEDTAPTLASDCDVDLTRDPVLKVFRRGTSNHAPLATIQQEADRRLQMIEASVNNAAVVRRARGLFTYTVVFYGRDGRVDRAFAATSNGYLYDAKTNRCYVGKRPWVVFVSQIASKEPLN